MSIIKRCKVCSKSGIFLKLSINGLCNECFYKLPKLQKKREKIKLEIQYKLNLEINIKELRSILNQLIPFYENKIVTEFNPKSELKELGKQEDALLTISEIKKYISYINSKDVTSSLIEDYINILRNKLSPKIEAFKSKGIEINNTNMPSIALSIEQAEKKLINRKKREEKKIYDKNNYVTFDLETTGLNPSFNEIIEIGAVKIKNGEIVDTFQSLIKPVKKISAKITSINHITNDMVKNEKGIEEVLPKFIEFIEKYPIIGHNVEFDYSFIKEAYKKLYDKEFKRKNICTMKLYRKYCKECSGEKPEGSKLGDCVDDLLSTKDIDEYYEGAHRALTDAKMVYKIYEILKD